MHLIIGNKAYSSWSLRPWLLLKQAGVPFEETVVPLYEEGSRERLLQYSPTGKVPCLIDGDLTIWESLAICEYLAERFPEKRLWPADQRLRAEARTYANEMHAGFGALRQHCPFNARRRLPARQWPVEVERDVARIGEIWTLLRRRYGEAGPFLFGDFSIADAMYAPVAIRARTYALSLPPEAQAYAETLWALPAIKEWDEAALLESWVLPGNEL